MVFYHIIWYHILSNYDIKLHTSYRCVNTGSIGSIGSSGTIASIGSLGSSSTIGSIGTIGFIGFSGTIGFIGSSNTIGSFKCYRYCRYTL